MNRQIDMKSLLLGVLLTVGIMFIAGATSNVVQSNPGRYQVSASGEGWAFMVDSQDGRVWVREQSGLFDKVGFVTGTEP